MAVELSPPKQLPEKALGVGRVVAMLAGQDDTSRKSSFHTFFVDDLES